MLTPEASQDWLYRFFILYLQPYSPKFKKQGRKRKEKFKVAIPVFTAPASEKAEIHFFNALKHTFISPLLQCNKGHTNFEFPVFPGTADEPNRCWSPPKFTLFLTLLSSQWITHSPFQGSPSPPSPKAQHPRHTRGGKEGFKPCQEEVLLFNSKPASASGLRLQSRKVHTAHCPPSVGPGSWIIRIFDYLLTIYLYCAGHEVLPASPEGQQGRNQADFNPVTASQVIFDHQIHTMKCYYSCLSRAPTEFAYRKWNMLALISWIRVTHAWKKPQLSPCCPRKL